MKCFSYHNHIGDIAVWHMEESPTQLSSMLPTSVHYSGNAVKRLLEFLSVRVLAQSMGIQATAIQYKASGQPYLPEGYISISHTAHHAAVFFSSHQEHIGIDIEHISKQVIKVRHKYLHPEELADIQGIFDKKALNEEDYIRMLLLYWCSKEAMYKAAQQQGIDFIKDMRVSGADPLEDEGDVIGCCLSNNYRIHYWMKPDYVLCCCSPAE